MFPTLLLKIVKSEDCNCPVLTAEANGRLIVRELVEVEMLKIFPDVPVETVVMTLLERVI